MARYNGWIVVATYGTYLASILIPSVLILATLLAWMVPLLLWRSLGKSGVQQALLLFSLGVGALVFSLSQGVFLGWREIFAVNLPLLAMFVAVAFLSLTSPDREDPDLPKGNQAVVTTAFGIHFLGAVINLSAFFVIAERLLKNGTLSREQMIILARSFCSAAWWSPFFIATGVALTYAPAMEWQQTLIPGAIMALVAITYSIVEVCFFRKSEFSGYPMRSDSLAVPVLLATAVICVHHFYPGMGVLLLICLIAPVGALIFMRGRPRLPTVRTFINTRMSAVNSQFALFLAAGVFSTGIKSITHVYPTLFSLEGLVFTPALFTSLLVIMTFVGIVGMHPIVTISIVSPLIIPLSPDPSQLGFLFLSVWAISTACSPLSAVGLAMVSRYRASPKEILSNHYHYAVVMCLIASLMNLLYFSS